MQVVCRQLGYPADGHAYSAGTQTPLLPPMPSRDQPQFITFAQCNGTEPGLGACRGRPINSTYKSCGPDFTAQVACYSQKRECNYVLLLLQLGAATDAHTHTHTHTHTHSVLRVMFSLCSLTHCHVSFSYQACRAHSRRPG